MYSTNIPNINYVNVSTNEPINKFVFNRNFQKLLNNDKQIESLKQDIISGKVKSWDEYETYNAGEIVWYVEDSYYKSNRKVIYLLRSLINNNNNKPTYKKDDKDIIYDFSESGWEDLGKVSSIVQNSVDKLANQITRYLIETLHELSETYHPYGEVNEENIDGIILKKDISNLDSNRKTFFCPYETTLLNANNSIIDGYYRKWDNGILEYNITYKLAFYGTTSYIDGEECDVLECNKLTLSDDQYYNNTESQTIFNGEYSSEYEQIGNHFETNKSPFVNYYSTTISFPVEFLDNRYMIFGQNLTKQFIIGGEEGYSLNNIVFTNKTTKSIDPLLILYPNNGNEEAKNTGIKDNIFNCSIIGRWK